MRILIANLFPEVIFILSATCFRLFYFHLPWITFGYSSSCDISTVKSSTEAKGSADTSIDLLVLAFKLRGKLCVLAVQMFNRLVMPTTSAGGFDL
jgi:hypothetical protein